MALSVLGHGLVWLALIHQQPPPGPPTPLLKQTALEVRLIEPTAPLIARSALPPLPEDDAPTVPMTREPSPAQAQTAPLNDVPTESPTDPAEKESAAHNKTRLITRLNQQLPKIIEELTPAPSKDTAAEHQIHQVPKLPGAPSLFDAWLKPTTPSLEQWTGQEGGFHSRQVLSDGTVLCTRLQAPTTQEIFNPWMSAAVSMMRGCGQKSAPEMDLTNPWLRTRPADRTAIHK